MLFSIATTGAIKGVAGLKALLVFATVLFVVGEIIAWVSRSKDNTESEDNYKK